MTITRGCAFLALFVLLSVEGYAHPIIKRSSLDKLYDSNRALQGVEVNGLFNPMERRLTFNGRTNLTVSVRSYLKEPPKNMEINLLLIMTFV
jgi:hypothetical protein